MPIVVAACLVAISACQSATVRGTQGQSLTATTPTSMTIHRGDTAADLVDDHAADVTASAGPGGIAVSQPIGINVRERGQDR